MDQKPKPLVMKVWEGRDCVVFHKVKEGFGGLSNMSNEFPLVVGGVAIRSSEALYQAMKFPHLPAVQRAILAEKSPIKYSRESTWILPASRLVNLRKALSLTVLRVSLSLEPNPQEHGCCRRCKHC